MNTQCRQIQSKLKSRDPVCEQVLELLSLLSNKTRFRILCLLREGDFCVNDIAEVVDLGNVSHVSQQLKMLALSGIVARRREAKRVVYSLKDNTVRKLLQYLEKTFLEGEA